MHINNLSFMLEYIFFHRTTCHLFKKTATTAGISAIITCAEASFIVKLAEDSDEKTLEKLEDYYDELMDIDRDLAEKKWIQLKISILLA